MRKPPPAERERVTVRKPPRPPPRPKTSKDEISFKIPQKKVPPKFKLRIPKKPEVFDRQRLKVETALKRAYAQTAKGNEHAARRILEQVLPNENISQYFERTRGQLPSTASVKDDRGNNIPFDQAVEYWHQQFQQHKLSARLSKRDTDREDWPQGQDTRAAQKAYDNLLSTVYNKQVTRESVDHFKKELNDPLKKQMMDYPKGKGLWIDVDGENKLYDNVLKTSLHKVYGFRVPDPEPKPPVQTPKKKEKPPEPPEEKISDPPRPPAYEPEDAFTEAIMSEMEEAGFGNELDDVAEVVQEKPPNEDYPAWRPGMRLQSKPSDIQMIMIDGKAKWYARFTFIVPGTKSAAKKSMMKGMLFDSKDEVKQFQIWAKQEHNKDPNVLSAEFQRVIKRTGRGKKWVKMFAKTKPPRNYRDATRVVKKLNLFKEGDSIDLSWKGNVPAEVIGSIKKQKADKHARWGMRNAPARGSYKQMNNIIASILSDDKNWQGKTDLYSTQVEAVVLNKLKTYGIDFMSYSANGRTELKNRIAAISQAVQMAFDNRSDRVVANFFGFIQSLAHETPISKDERTRERDLSIFSEAESVTWSKIDIPAQFTKTRLRELYDRVSRSRSAARSMSSFRPGFTQTIPDEPITDPNELARYASLSVVRAPTPAPKLSLSRSPEPDRGVSVSPERPPPKSPRKTKEMVLPAIYEMGPPAYPILASPAEQIKMQDTMSALDEMGPPTVDKASPAEQIKMQDTMSALDEMGPPAYPILASPADLLQLREPLPDVYEPDPEEKLEEKMSEVPVTPGEEKISDEPRKPVRKRKRRPLSSFLLEPVGTRGYNIRVNDEEDTVSVIKPVKNAGRRGVKYAQMHQKKRALFQVSDILKDGRLLSLDEFKLSRQKDLHVLSHSVGDRSIARSIYRNLKLLAKHKRDYQSILKMVQFGRNMQKSEQDVSRAIQQDPIVRQRWMKADKQEVGDLVSETRNTFRTLTADALDYLNEYHMNNEQRGEDPLAWSYWMNPRGLVAPSVVSSVNPTLVPQNIHGARLFAQVRALGIPMRYMDDWMLGRMSEHRVKMFSTQAAYENVPLNTFPYKEGEYAVDDKGWGKEFEGFVRAAHHADPLAKMSGKKSQIGNYVSILATPDRYHMIVYKDVPPRALKLLCSQIKKHVKSLPPMAHVELFRDLGSEYKLVLSADRVRQIGLAALARVLISFVGKKKKGHYVHFVLLQTIPGGSLHNYGGIL